MPLREVIGHRKLVSLLSRSIERDALPPSLIFAGPAGIGKRLTAVAIAQTLNCPSPRRDSSESGEGLACDACGVCTACTRIARGVHPDVLIVKPGDSGSIKIEAIRDLVERAAYRPFEGRRRVVIIDQADALVPAAQNALLKTLEEPPSLSCFILVTARPDALLATVRSRCPRLRFQPLGAEDVAEALVRQGRSDVEARAIAATADGSVGGALDASGSDLMDARNAALRFLTEAASGDQRRRLESARELLPKTGAGAAGDREQLAMHLKATALLLRDVALLATGAERSTLVNRDVESVLTQLSAFRGERGTRAFAAVDRALSALERNASAKIVADWVVLELQAVGSRP